MEPMLTNKLRVLVEVTGNIGDIYTLGEFQIY